MSHGYLTEATYESGFLMLEHPDADVNPYDPLWGNFFTAVVNHLPTRYGHGRLVRLSLIPLDGGTRYDLDWRDKPDDAVPVVERDMAMMMVMGGEMDGAGPQPVGFRFGWRHANGNDGEIISF